MAPDTRKSCKLPTKRLDDYLFRLQIRHSRQFNSLTEILPEIYKIVGDEYFVPVGYRTSLQFDYFFINNQGKALKKLFENDLRITINKRYVDLEVRFCVSKFKDGMLIPREKLDKIIADSIRPSNPEIADLSHISTHQQLVDVKLSLSNKGCFDLFCLRMNLARTKLQHVRMLLLSNNEIHNLEPMEKLFGVSFNAIDLRFNKIASIDGFRFLKTLNLQELLLSGNSVTAQPMFMEKIKEILPTLKRIDGHELEQRNVHSILPLPHLQTDNSSDPIEFFDLANETVIRSADINDHVKKEFPKYNMNGLWSKVVIVHNGKVSKGKILEEMNKQFFKRIPFYPCYYQASKKTDSFLLHQNFTALETLVQNNLSMEVPPLNCKMKFDIHLNCAEFTIGQINWSHKINYVIQKRTRMTSLNLDDFANDIDFNDLDISMTTVSGLSSIVNSAIIMNRSIITMSLQNNKISSMEGLMDLRLFPNLVSLDLRNNCIESFEGFPPISTLLELNLDKNPFCVQYYDKPWKYVQDLLEIFPNLKHIDGRRIDSNMKPVVVMQNFLVSPALYTLTESFVKFFFELYDLSNLQSLRTLYNNESLFRLTTDANLSCKGSTIIYPYLSFNVDSRNTFIGNKSIIEVFTRLPLTQHDFTTMCIDAPLMTERNVLIHVNGFFKEPGKTLNDCDVIYGFTRTFYLERTIPKAGTMDNTFKYLIKNEQLHIRCVTQDELNKAFKNTVATDDEMRNICKDMLPVKSQEEEANVLLMTALTQLDKTWCIR